MKIFQTYKPIKTLGVGRFGKVFLTQFKQQKYILKKISKKLINQSPQVEQYINSQINCMIHCQSQYIMRIIKKQEDEDDVYLICEYCNLGNLYQYQSNQKQKVFELKKAVSIIYQIILGLMQLHKLEYFYKDLKPQNVLVTLGTDNKQKFKLADFGCQLHQTLNKQFYKGAVNYIAPERIRQQLELKKFLQSQQIQFSGQIPKAWQNSQDSDVGFASDMWSLGVLFYYMLNMEYPFKGLSENDNQNLLIIEKGISSKFNYSQWVKFTKLKLTVNSTKDVNDLFSKIFVMDPKQRISFDDIKKHALFKQFFHQRSIMQQSSRIYDNKQFQSRIKLKQCQFNKSRINFQKSKISPHFNLQFNKKKLNNLPQDSFFILKNKIKQQQSLPGSQIPEISRFQNKITNQNLKKSTKLSSPVKNLAQISEQCYINLPSSNLKMESNIKIGAEQIRQISKGISFNNSSTDPFQKQNRQYIFDKQKNQLLLQISQSFMQQIKQLSIGIRLALRYYTLKLFIIYHWQLLNRYKAKQIPNIKKNYKWKQFFQSDEYCLIVKQVQQKIEQQQKKFEQIYKICATKLQYIETNLKLFRNGFTKNILENDFIDEFKRSYRITTGFAYSSISNTLKKQNQLDPMHIQKLYCYLINIFICHCFNRIFTRSEIHETFKYYFIWKKEKMSRLNKLVYNQQFEFESFKKWITVQSRQNLKQTTKIILKKYFS